MHQLDDDLMDRIGLAALSPEQREAVRAAATELVGARTSLLAIRVLSRRQVDELAKASDVQDTNRWVSQNLPEFMDLQLRELQNVVALIASVVDQVHRARSGDGDE